MQLNALAFDLICFSIVALTALYFSGRGGLMGLLSMVGTVLAAGVSMFAARSLASPVFDTFFRDRLITGLEESFLHQSAQEPRLALEEFSRQLPSGLQDTMLAAMEQIDIGTEGYVELLVNDVVKAILLPAIVLLLFLLFFALLRPIVGVLLHLLRRGRDFAKLKTPQRIAGALIGVLLGGVYALVLVNVAAGIAPIMEFPFFQSNALEDSFFYTLFANQGLIL